MHDLSLAVALGANLPSAVGGPRDTLLAVRPLLEQTIRDWSAQQPGFRWSPLMQTDPVGGPADQPIYVNAVLLVNGLEASPSASAWARWWARWRACWRASPALGPAGA